MESSKSLSQLSVSGKTVKTRGREGEGEEERREEIEVRQEKKEGRESEILKQSRDGRQKIKNKCPKLQTLTFFFAKER